MSRRIVDLTFPIHEGMTTFPAHWHPMVEVTQLGRHGLENRETRKLVLGTHTGTHCDAPLHFIPGGDTVDRLPLDLLIGPALLADLSRVPPRQAIPVETLERELGDKRPARLVLRFDWSDAWGSPRYYADHPYLSVPAAAWLAERGVRLLAMDTPQPDNPAHGWRQVPDAPIHRLLLGQGVILVEYLCHLREIVSREFELVVLPLKVQGADGAPARCVAIEDAREPEGAGP